jgi:hypothetical protein
MIERCAKQKQALVSSSARARQLGSTQGTLTRAECDPCDPTHPVNSALPAFRRRTSIGEERVRRLSQSKAGQTLIEFGKLTGEFGLIRRVGRERTFFRRQVRQWFARHPGIASAKKFGRGVQDQLSFLQGWSRDFRRKNQALFPPDPSIELHEIHEVREVAPAGRRVHPARTALLWHNTPHGQVATICTVSRAVASQHPNCCMISAISRDSPGVAEVKVVCYRLLSVSIDSARVLLPRAETRRQHSNSLVETQW